MEKLKAKSSKPKAQSQKLKAQSQKQEAYQLPKTQRAESLELRAKSSLEKLKAQKSLITRHPLPITNIKSQIYQAINRVKIYPRAAKRVGAQGSVNTCFTLGANRSVSNITTQGAHPFLQKGARATIQKAKENFPNIPSPRHLCVTISYVLE